jgi:putative restriction endonuclease
MSQALSKYIKAFNKLKRGTTKYGPAPHKPILLLSILQAVQNQMINSPQIYVSGELICLFKATWSKLVNTSHVCNFTLPFFHLHKERSRIWKLIANPGFEVSLFSQESMSSLGTLNTQVHHAEIPEDLFLCMLDPKANHTLQVLLLDTYFTLTKQYYTDNATTYLDLFHQIENKLLEESPAQYAVEIKQLLADHQEEEVFMRGSVFKREIPKLYQNTCCISGLKVESIRTVSMIDACHIIPFSESYNDTVSNGIALSPTLHRAFDRGLISIDKEYRVMIAKDLYESASAHSIKSFEGKTILLPSNPKFHPAQENFKWHRGRFGFEG